MQLWKDFDRNHIPAPERVSMCYARGIALAVFKRIRAQCIIRKPDGEIVHDLPSQHVVELLTNLLTYKKKATGQKLDGAPHCTSWKLMAQVLNVVKCDPSFQKIWGVKERKSTHNLSVTLCEGCTVEWKDDTASSVSETSKLFLFHLFCEAQSF